MKEKVYRGQLVRTGNGEEDDLLGLVHEGSFKTTILADEISEDMEWREYPFLSVRYYSTDAMVPADRVELEHIKTLYGKGDVKYSMRYSDITGYLWTDEDLNIGGHNLLTELKDKIGKYLHMEIKFSREKPRAESKEGLREQRHERERQALKDVVTQMDLEKKLR